MGLHRGRRRYDWVERVGSSRRISDAERRRSTGVISGRGSVPAQAQPWP